MEKCLESHIFYGITVSFPQTLLAVKMINYDVAERYEAGRCTLFQRIKLYDSAAPSQSIHRYMVWKQIKKHKLHTIYNMKFLFNDLYSHHDDGRLYQADISASRIYKTLCIYLYHDSLLDLFVILFVAFCTL